VREAAEKLQGIRLQWASPPGACCTKSSKQLSPYNWEACVKGAFN
jgi:hypothetical protein